MLLITSKQRSSRQDVYYMQAQVCASMLQQASQTLMTRTRYTPLTCQMSHTESYSIVGKSQMVTRQAPRSAAPSCMRCTCCQMAASGQNTAFSILAKMW